MANSKMWHYRIRVTDAEAAVVMRMVDRERPGLVAVIEHVRSSGDPEAEHRLGDVLNYLEMIDSIATEIATASHSEWNFEKPEGGK